MRLLRTLLLIAVSSFLLAPSGIRAACGAYIPVHSAARGSYAYTYVQTPGVCPDGPPCSGGTSVSASFRGSFWALGHGDPAPDHGIDSGVWQALDPLPAGTGWTYALAGDPLLLWGNWNDPRVDGCIGPGTCTAALVGDQRSDGRVGYFAVLSDKANVDGAFEYGGPALDAIRLAEVPWPRVLQSSHYPDRREIRIAAPILPAGGTYLDPACPPGVLRGYKVYRYDRLWSQPEPDRNREPWTPAEGGTAPGGGPIPIDTPTTVILRDVGCGPSVAWLLAIALVFDSGFETPYVSANVSIDRYSIICTVDADCDGFCEFCECGIHDCDDSNPDVGPEAPQICDHLNNDCSDPNWPSLEGTNEAGPDDDGDGWTGQCDNCPTFPNPGREDADGDGFGDACDACPALADPRQVDRDQDGQGDLCDLDDGTILLWVDGENLVRWQPESPFTSWNLYRGDLAVLRSVGEYTQAPGSNPIARRDCELADPATIDPDVPLVGQAAFYLVTGNAQGSEGSLGTNGAGVERLNQHPCP